MNKYIDADKLKKLIDDKWKELADKNVKVGGGKWDAEISTYLSVLRLIDTLQQERPALRGWVAREDKGRLFLFGEKPLRNGNYGWKSSSFCIELNSNLYPDLMWIDDPIEVELSINKK